MTDLNFDDLFGEKGAEGRHPTVCAVTGQRLRKTDHTTRQAIAGTKLYVMHTRPLLPSRLEELTKLAKAGAKSAVKAPAKEE